MDTRTRGWFVAAAAAAVALITACAAPVASPVSSPVAVGSPVAGPSTGSPAPSVASTPAVVAPTPTVAPTPSVVTHVNACAAADLDPRPIYEYDGGMGSAFQTVVVRNVTHSACRLDSPVKLLYTDRHGVRRTLSTTRGAVAPPAAYTVPPGGYAEFAVRTVNGQPSGDACGRAIDYTGLSVGLSAGVRFPLRGTDIEVTCPHVGPGELNGVAVTDWGTSIWPTPEGATITRAPAP